MKNKNKTSGLKYKKEDPICELDLFDILMDNIPDSIYFKDRQCRFIRINRRMMQSLSVQDMSQMIGKTDIDMFGEEFGRKALTEDLHLMETGEPIIGLIEKRKLNWTSTTKVPLQNDSGQIVGLVGITREINEIMETEEALAYERDLLHTLMDNIPDHIYFKDKESRFIRINKAQAVRFKLNNPGEAVGKTDHDFFSREHADQAYADEQELMRTSRPMVAKEEKETWPNGSETWVSTTKLPRYDEEGNIVGTFGISRDITRIKQAEAALIHESALLKTLMDNIPDFIYFKDRESKFIRVSKAKAEEVGEDTESIIGETDFDHFSEGEAIRKFEDEKLIMEKEEPIISLEEKVTKPGRGEFWVSTTKLPRYDEEGNIVGTFGISRDITKMKKAEERQVQLLKELESANTELKDFAYIVSHDLKTPLRGVGSLAKWLSTDYKDKFDEDGKELLDLLMGRIKRMHNLIDGILQYSRIGRLREEKDEVNLNEIVKDVIDMIAPPENIKITIENELPSILCEKTRIGQVFQNLLSNAIKYMDKPKGKIKIGCNEDEEYWKFSISDNGPGIDKKHFKKVFQLFQTLKPRDEIEGTGIGLSVVKKIIELYSGTIWVDSKIGEGSTFYFTLSKENVKI